MQLQATQQFHLARRRARRIAEIATEKRLRPLTYEEMEPPLHAALAAYVSAWEAFVEDITLEFLRALVGALSQKPSAFAKILHDEAERVIGRFNNPNFSESRNLILRFTGFDPFAVMTSPRLGMTPPQTQTRLDEILRVRHAFAHGRPLPNFTWLSRYGQNTRLTKKAVKSVDVLLTDLVGAVESALKGYAQTTFGATI